MITLVVDDELLPAAARLGASRYATIASAVAAVLIDAPDGEIAVTYVTESDIQRLNRMYRGKDAVTDVLSFASGFPEHHHELGDVLICYAQAVRQAEGGDIELECVDLVVHGILHVLGYDHERGEDADVMFPLQDRIVAASL